MHFSQRLKQVRERRGFSQNGLAKTSGVAQAIIQRLEAGTRDVERLSVGVARRLARALGVSLDYLIGMYEEDEDEPAQAVAD
jgi:transcriptional regulator with XRE-family HTH domain